MLCKEIFFCVMVIGFLHSAAALSCYECSVTLGPTDTDPCYYGDYTRMRRVHCIGPSVCAVYRYEKHYPSQPTEYHVTRGCQAIEYGSTCEDIFNELRSRGPVMPGLHSCNTCNMDFCNSSRKIQGFGLLLSLTLSLIVLKA